MDQQWKNFNKDFFSQMITQRMEDRWWIIFLLISVYLLLGALSNNNWIICCFFSLSSDNHWLDLGLDRLEIKLIPLYFLSCSNVDVGKKRVYTFLAWTTGGSATRKTLALGRGQAQAGGRQRFSLQERWQQSERGLLPVPPFNNSLLLFFFYCLLNSHILWLIGILYDRWIKQYQRC